MTANALGGLISAVVYVAFGLGVMALARAGERRTLDWSWGGRTRDNTPPDIWDAAHRRAAPSMRRAGMLFVFAGLVAGVLVAWRETVGVVVLCVLTVAALLAVFASIRSGLAVLAETASDADPNA